MKQLTYIVAEVNAEFSQLEVRNIQVIRRARYLFDMATHEIAAELEVPPRCILRAEEHARKNGY